MSELLPIKKIFNFEKGSLQSTKCTPGDFTFVTAGTDWKTHNEFTHEAEALILAVAASGSLGRCHYIKDKFIASDLCFILTPKDSKTYPIDLEFYHQIFRSIKSDLVQKTATGTSKLSINRTNFGNYKIPYFEIEHQKTFKKILLNVNDKKDKLLVCSDNQENLVKILRNQILQDAISGKLTFDWRTKNPDIEPASKLLEKIKAEKEKLIAEKKIKKEKPLPKIAEDEIPFELPEQWEWCRLGELGLVTRGKSPEYETKSNAFSLNQKCIRWDYIDTEFVKEVKKTWLDRVDSKFLTKSGDILVNSTGEGTIGRSAIVDEKSAEMIFDSHVLCFKKLGNVVSKFAMFLINSQFGQRQINDSKGAKTTKQTELGVENLRNLIIPLPPLAEQKAIVTKIEKIIKQVSQLEEKIKQNKQDAEMLMQSFLVEAFKN